MTTIFNGMPECKWCGNQHDPADLCRALRVSRRTFLFASGAAAVGVVAMQLPLQRVVPAKDLLVKAVFSSYGTSGGVPTMRKQFVVGLNQEVNGLIRDIMRKTNVELAGDLELDEMVAATGGKHHGKQIIKPKVNKNWPPGSFDENGGHYHYEHRVVDGVHQYIRHRIGPERVWKA
jgi:hypothetical protein